MPSSVLCLLVEPFDLRLFCPLVLRGGTTGLVVRGVEEALLLEVCSEKKFESLPSSDSFCASSRCPLTYGSDCFGTGKREGEAFPGL